jgi:hypothetical protein
VETRCAWYGVQGGGGNPQSAIGIPPIRGWRIADRGGVDELAKLKSAIEVTCPCCHSVLIVDTNLRRVISHVEPESGDKPELGDAQRILADAQARREALFEQSFQAEKTKGDALSKRFEEALKQAQEEPITKPMRDFDLD